MTRRIRRTLTRDRGERGQALVVAALVALVVTVAVFLTFAIGHRTREKIKLQAMADASAYSLAVAEARAFNFYAWSNRAIVAHYVSILSVQSHQSYITWYEQLLRNTADNYRGMAGLMSLYCTLSRIPKSPACKPCPTVCQASQKVKDIAKVFKEDTGGYDWMHERWHTKKDNDKTLHAGARSHFQVAAAIRQQQKDVHLALRDQMIANQGLARELAQVVDKRIEAPPEASTVNTRYYDRAVIDDPARSDDYHEILSGTRFPDWLTKRGYRPGARWLALMGKAQSKATPDMTFTSVTNEGNSKTLGTEPAGINGLKQDVHRSGHNAQGFGGGLGAAAEDHGQAFTTYVPLVCPCIGIGTKNQNRIGVWTDPEERHNHGTHWFHTGTATTEENPMHDLGGCTTRGSRTTCGIYQGYMRYRLAEEGTEALWNAPRTLALLTRPVAQKHAWDFNFKVTLPTEASFTTTRSKGDGATSGQMAAIAAGLVYYHKPDGWGDDWREPPNFWNPFWRAKLHAIPPDDARTVFAAGHKASEKALNSLSGVNVLNY